MSPPILSTKLYIPPPRPDLVSRPHLIERLNEGLQRRLTLISAPAGFGKTTLISEWLEQSSLSMAWLSLDEGDNDLVRFLLYLVAALETVQPDVGSDIQILLQSPQPPPLETSMTLIINQLANVSTQFVLVLDDYHIIEQPAMHEALTFLLDHLPAQMHLVIATRADPPLPLARLRTRDQLVELRAEDLRFTLDETVLFLNQVMGLELRPADITALEARTEGWIAGLQLAALSIRSKVTPQASDFIAAFSGSHRHVIDFLAEEVMAQQPEEVHDFLYQTAILDRLTAPLCNAVTGRQHSEAILEQLEQANLFLIPLDDQRQWYRYHHLFADFLRSRLYQYRAKEVPGLHHRASMWYEQQGVMTAAIDHALSGGNYSRAADLMEEIVDTIFMWGELTTLQRWIELLPDQVAQARPQLYVYYAVLLIFGGNSLENAISHLPTAIKADQAGPVAGGVSAFRAWIAAIQGDIHQTIELSQQALQLLPENRLFLRSLVSVSLGLVYFLNGDVEHAFRAFSKVAAIGQKTGSLMLTVLALRRLGDVRLLQGQLNQAKTYYEQALNLALDRQGQPRPIAGMPLAGLGWLHLEWNDLERALQYLTKGIALTNKWSAITGLHGHITLAMAKQAQGDSTGANQAIKAAQQLALKFDTTETDDIFVGAYQARLWVTQGNFAAVRRWADERQLALAELTGLDSGTTEAKPPSLTLLRTLEYIPLARLYLAKQQLNDALAILEPLLLVTQQAGWLWFSLEILILQAIAYHHRDESHQAIAVLEQALVLAEPEGFVRIFIEHGPPLDKLLRQAAAQGITVNYVGQLLEAFQTKWQQSIPAVPSTLVDPLSGRELEVLRLLATGLSNKEMADTLIITVGTVKKHLKNIYEKLNVHSRTAAVAQARDLDLL